ncbi:MAG: stage V sporulation protein AC [Syntrophomonadaceae bacterium]|jgi:stage V sporulation protein AC|nr:stage V sporulation protein AC [Syntrophomonadaceae bacterium]
MTDMSEQTKLQKEAAKEYDELVKSLGARPPVLKNCIWAFTVGGLICVLGQGLLNFFELQGLAALEAGSAASMTLIFLGALLTGIGVYDTIGKYAGAGSIIPITGFANSIVAAAMEFKREGFVFGMGARMFQIAGPVLVFGTITASLIGLIAFIFKG